MAASVRKRPLSGSATGRVWEIADDLMRRRGGQLPTGREVVDAYMQEEPGRNEGTGFTQYSHWKKAHLAHSERGPRPRVSADGSVRVTIGPDGRLVIPASVREALGWKSGDELVLRHDDRGVHIESRRAALARAQALVAAFDKGAGSAVEELIAERRQAAEHGE